MFPLWFQSVYNTGRRKDVFDDILFHVSCSSPKLTWRDVQHLIAKTAKIPDPEEPGWNINAAGHHVHHRYCETFMQTFNGLNTCHHLGYIEAHLK